MVVNPKIVTAYARLTDKELADWYELRWLLEPEQRHAIIFVRARREEEKPR